MIRVIRYSAFAMLAVLYTSSTAATLLGETTVPSRGTGHHAVDCGSEPRPEPPRLVFIPRRHMPLTGEISCSSAPCIILPSILPPDVDAFTVDPPPAGDVGVVFGGEPPRDRAPPAA